MNDSSEKRNRQFWLLNFRIRTFVKSAENDFFTLMQIELSKKGFALSLSFRKKGFELGNCQFLLG